MKTISINAVGQIYQSDFRRLFATLVRLLHDFDLAEDVLHEAFATAIEQWPKTGIPQIPRAWLISTAHFKAIDILRRRGRLQERLSEVYKRGDELAHVNALKADEEIEDDRLRLIFTCCHPAIDSSVQVPLTLREVCGLTTEEIATAFLTPHATMAQRIVRGKAKIRTAAIPFVVPTAAELPERLDSVLTVIYLVFNEGYSASQGDTLTRADLSGEAIRLGRMLSELLPEPEVVGLLALMLLQESRRTARMSASGDIILLEDQDRSLWSAGLIKEGQTLVENALSSQHFGPYSLQAAIAAVHANAPTPERTDWAQIAALYDALLAIYPSPVVELNRAVAIAMRDGPQHGLTLIEAILRRGELVEFHLAHAARAELCRRLGRSTQAKSAYERALSLVRQEPERRFLTRRLREVS